MQNSIVCGVDGSTDSRAALDVAARLADRLGLRLVLAHVVDYVPSPYATAGAMGLSAGGAGAPFTDMHEEREREAEILLDEMAYGANVQAAARRVVTGGAAERLAELGEEENAEMIVVGSRGRGAFKAAFLGSVSTSLLGVAHCPVLVVPPGATR